MSDRVSLKTYHFLYTENKQKLYKYDKLIDTVTIMYNNLLSKEYQFSILTNKFTTSINWESHPFIESLIDENHKGFNDLEISRYSQLNNFTYLDDSHIPLLSSIKTILSEVSHNFYHSSNLLKFSSNFEINVNADSPYFENLTNLNDTPLQDFLSAYSQPSQYSGIEGLIVDDIVDKITPTLLSNYKIYAKTELSKLDLNTELLTGIISYYSQGSVNIDDMSDELAKYLILSNTDEFNLNTSSQFFITLKNACVTNLEQFISNLGYDIFSSTELDVFNNNVLNKWISFLIINAKTILNTNSNSAVTFLSETAFNESGIFTDIIDSYAQSIQSVESLAMLNISNPQLYINSRYYLYTKLIEIIEDFDIDFEVNNIQESIDGSVFDINELQNILNYSQANLNSMDELKRIISQEIYKLISVQIQTAFKSNNVEILNILSKNVPTANLSKNYNHILQFISLYIMRDILDIRSTGGLYETFINKCMTSIIDDAFINNSITSAININSIQVSAKTFYTSIYSVLDIGDNVKNFYLSSAIASKFHGILNQFRI